MGEEERGEQEWKSKEGGLRSEEGGRGKERRSGKIEPRGLERKKGGQKWKSREGGHVSEKGN